MNCSARELFYFNLAKVNTLGYIGSMEKALKVIGLSVLALVFYIFSSYVLYVAFGVKVGVGDVPVYYAGMAYGVFFCFVIMGSDNGNK